MSETADPARLKKLSEELRCLVCQNQTLADSNAELAVDLRRQVETMISGGRSDREIRDYMVERYGDFVLYRPPMQGNTLALWLGPFAMLAGGGLIWWLVQRRSRLAAQSSSANPGSAQVSAPQDQAALSNRRDRARDLLRPR
jgi:cytochrome c-type biogenesis protein CcmH